MAEDTNTSSGLALYRKYRPATFAELRGQDHVTEPLRQALRSGRINHAYLFSGPRGCGKTSSARILARSLNCVNGPTPDPCGVCESCIALAPSGPGSIDVIEIDAASHGGVDDARDLRERAFYAPVAGRYKIYIIDEAHMVTSQGFNALLKLVEEPPPHLMFIFATTEPDKVIATIRSRTHHYPFRLMPPSVMSGLLTDILNDEGVPFEPAVIPLVVQAGAGSARDSLSILDQLLAGSDENGIRYDRAVALLGYTDASLLDEISDAFAVADGARVFRVVNQVIEGGHEPRRFATDMLDRFRDLIVLASVPDAIQTGLLTVPPDRADVLTAQAGKWGLAALTRAAEIVSNGLDQMRGATSPRLLLELMCAQVLLPGAAADERSILARLERLETNPPERAIPAPHIPPAPPIPAPPAMHPVPDPVPPPVPQTPPMPAADPRPADQPGTGVPPASQRAVPAAAAATPASPASQAGSGESPASHSQAGAGEPPASQRPAPVSGPRSEARGTSAEQRREDGGPRQAGGERDRQSGGGITADSIRQDWHNVLELIKAKRRVAWMMLQNASVVSFEENVLMLRFPRPGDVKGFTTGGYEETLKQAMQARYGVNLVVRAISGPDAGPGGRGPAGRGPAPAPVSPAADSTGPPGPGPAAGTGAAMDSGPAMSRPGSDQGQGAAGGLGAAMPVSGQGLGPSAAAAPGMAVPAMPAGAPSAPAPSGVPAAAPSFAPNDVPFPADDDFDPDDEDMSAPIAVDLTGMALVQRELGGEIIAEYED
jgi:DNA polymerase III subunit gamma/tau